MSRRERIFWLFVGAALVVGFIALIPVHGEICKESTKPGEEACTAYRLVPFLIIQIGKFLDAIGVAITALATIAIAWFTLTLRRSTDKLWKAGDDQLDHLKGASERQLRAYLVPSGGEIVQIPGGFRMTVALRNTGQTPAFDVRVMSESFGGKYPLEGEHPHSPPQNDYSTILGSGDEFHCLRRIFADSADETLRSVQSGEMGLWIQGWAIYKDCFGKWHHTKFRRVFGGPLVSGGDLLLHADRDGNEGD